MSKQNDQIVAELEGKIEEAKTPYLEAIKFLNTQKSSNAPKQDQIEALEKIHAAGTKFFNHVENACSKGELLGGTESDAWAANLGATAVNVLENVLSFWEKIRRESTRLKCSDLEPSTSAYFMMQAMVRRYAKDQVHRLRSEFVKQKLPTRGFDHAPKMNKRYSSGERWALIGIATGFLLLMIAVAAFDKNPSDLGVFIYRTVLALMAAAFGSIAITGFIRVEGKIGQWLVRAGGGFALFLLVYFLNPPRLVNQSERPSPQTNAVSTNGN